LISSIRLSIKPPSSSRKPIYLSIYLHLSNHLQSISPSMYLSLSSYICLSVTFASYISFYFLMYISLSSSSSAFIPSVVLYLSIYPALCLCFIYIYIYIITYLA
jgi:hypothetical protein